MNVLPRVSVCFVLFLAIVPQYECNPFFWFPPRRATPVYNSSGVPTNNTRPGQQSNVSVSLGNRINTNTTLDDYGTRVDGVTVNVVRRRRRRDLWDNNGSLNGSYVAVGNQVFQLPDQLSNFSLNVVSSSRPASSAAPTQTALDLSTAFIPTIPDNYTEAFRALVTQFETLSLDTLDGITQYLAIGYNNTLGQLFVENAFSRLNQSLEYGRTAVQAGLLNLAAQGASGFDQLIQNFNSSSSRVQRCVGNNLNPSVVARTVVGRANECINAKWLELSELVGNIGEDVVAADHGATQFLGNLTACNGFNFEALNLTTAQRSALRRQCYVRAVQSFPQSLLFLPVSLTIDTAQLYASIQSLQTDVVVCGGQLALEIGLVTSQIGSKILLCQVFPS